MISTRLRNIRECNSNRSRWEKLKITVEFCCTYSGGAMLGALSGAACREITLAALRPQLKRGLVHSTTRSLISFLRRLRSLDRLVSLSCLSLTGVRIVKFIPIVRCLVLFSWVPQPYTASYRAYTQTHAVSLNARNCTLRPVTRYNIVLCDDWVVRQLLVAFAYHSNSRGALLALERQYTGSAYT
jgi:hypothetical protein